MLKRSIVQCLKCNDIIESKHNYDYKECRCKSIFIDGGPEYPRFGYKPDEGDTSRDSDKYIKHLTDEMESTMSNDTRIVKIKLPTIPLTTQDVIIPKHDPYIVYITKCVSCKDIKAIATEGVLNDKCNKCDSTLTVLDWIDFN